MYDVTGRLARASSLHPGRALAAWGAALLLSLAAIVGLLGSALTTDAEMTNDPESYRGYDLIAEHFPPTGDYVNELVVVRSRTLTVDDAAFRAKVDSLRGAIEETGVTQPVRTYYSTQDATLVSPSRRATVIPVGLKGDGDAGIGQVIEVVDAAAGDGFETAITGEFTADRDFSTLSQEDLRKGELQFGLPAALVILLLVFGAVVAGLVPVLVALVAIVVALGLTALVGQAFDLSVFVVNMISGMGLALGIDYSLFVVSRFREERRHGHEKLDAITTVGSTASRAVLFSGSAFVLAMVGMVLVPDTILRSLATGAILVGMVTVVAALTLLPAVLSLLGDRVNALRVPWLGRRVEESAGAEGRVWSRVVRAVTRRPLVAAVLSAGLLVLAALPIFGIETGLTGVRELPDRFHAKRGFTMLLEEFGVGTVDSVQVVVEGDVASIPVKRAIAELARRVAPDPAFRTRRVDEPRREGGESRGARRRGQQGRAGARGGAAAAQRRRAGGVRRRRRPGARHRGDGRGDRLPRADGPLAADRLHVRARAQLPPPDARVPHDRPPCRRDRAQPALGRRGLRAAGARLRRRLRA